MEYKNVTRTKKKNAAIVLRNKETMYLRSEEHRFCLSWDFSQHRIKKNLSASCVLLDFQGKHVTTVYFDNQVPNAIDFAVVHTAPNRNKKRR